MTRQKEKKKKGLCLRLIISGAHTLGVGFFVGSDEERDGERERGRGGGTKEAKISICGMQGCTPQCHGRTALK